MCRDSGVGSLRIAVAALERGFSTLLSAVPGFDKEVDKSCPSTCSPRLSRIQRLWLHCSPWLIFIWSWISFDPLNSLLHLWHLEQRSCKVLASERVLLWSTYYCSYVFGDLHCRRIHSYNFRICLLLPSLRSHACSKARLGLAFGVCCLLDGRFFGALARHYCFEILSRR